MDKQQRLLRQPLPPLQMPLLLRLLAFCLNLPFLTAPPIGASVLPPWECTSNKISCYKSGKPYATAFVGLLPPVACLSNGNRSSIRGVINSSSSLFSRGCFRLHPRLRVRHMSRDSGSSHLLELSRQRLLLEREGDLEKYLNRPLLPFPAEGEVHSQRKRSKMPAPGGSARGPLLLYRKAKQLLMKHSGTSNNRQVLMLRDRLTLLVEQQHELLVDSPQSSVELLRKLWGIKPDEPHTLKQQQAQQQPQQQSSERENSLLQERRTRPLGSRFLFVCGIDLRMTGTDLENIFQTVTEQPVYARLKRNTGQ